MRRMQDCFARGRLQSKEEAVNEAVDFFRPLVMSQVDPIVPFIQIDLKFSDCFSD